MTEKISRPFLRERERESVWTVTEVCFFSLSPLGSNEHVDKLRLHILIAGTPHGTTPRLDATLSPASLSSKKALLRLQRSREREEEKEDRRATVSIKPGASPQSTSTTPHLQSPVLATQKETSSRERGDVSDKG